MTKREAIELAKSRYQRSVEFLEKGLVQASNSYALVGILGLLIDQAENYGESEGD